MLQRIVTYLCKHPLRVVRTIARDPREAWIKFEDRYYERRERRGEIFRYQAQPDWEERVHRMAGAPWPCEAVAQFWMLWGQVIGQSKAMGLRVGPESFGT